MLSGELPELSAEHALIAIDDPAHMALGSAGLTKHAAEEPLVNPEPGEQLINSAAKPLQAKKFSSASIVKITFAGRLLPEAF